MTRLPGDPDRLADRWVFEMAPTTSWARAPIAAANATDPIIHPRNEPCCLCSREPRGRTSQGEADLVHLVPVGTARPRGLGAGQHDGEDGKRRGDAHRDDQDPPALLIANGAVFSSQPSGESHTQNVPLTSPTPRST